MIVSSKYVICNSSDTLKEHYREIDAGRDVGISIYCTRAVTIIRESILTPKFSVFSYR